MKKLNNTKLILIGLILANLLFSQHIVAQSHYKKIVQTNLAFDFSELYYQCKLIQSDDFARVYGKKHTVELDSIVFEKLKKLTKENGLPTAESVGEDMATQPAVNMAQSAVLVQGARFLVKPANYAVFKKEMEMGRLDQSLFMRALDRYYVQYERKSLYGSPYKVWTPYKGVCIQDKNESDRLRKDIGLEPLKVEEFVDCSTGERTDISGTFTMAVTERFMIPDPFIYRQDSLALELEKFWVMDNFPRSPEVMGRYGVASLARMDSITFSQFVNFVEKNGLPTTDLIGEVNINQERALPQDAILLNNCQRLQEPRYYELFKKEVKAGRLSAEKFAEAMDRYYQVYEGKSVYGTAFKFQTNAKGVCYQDKSLSDRLRTDIGLEPLSDEMYVSCADDEVSSEALVPVVPVTPKKSNKIADPMAQDEVIPVPVVEKNTQQVEASTPTVEPQQAPEIIPVVVPNTVEITLPLKPAPKVNNTVNVQDSLAAELEKIWYMDKMAQSAEYKEINGEASVTKMNTMVFEKFADFVSNYGVPTAQLIGEENFRKEQCNPQLPILLHNSQRLQESQYYTLFKNEAKEGRLPLRNLYYALDRYYQLYQGKSVYDSPYKIQTRAGGVCKEDKDLSDRLRIDIGLDPLPESSFVDCSQK